MNTHIFKTILCFLGLICFTNSFAQIAKIQKADAKYDKYHYIDARDLFKSCR